MDLQPLHNALITRLSRGLSSEIHGRVQGQLMKSTGFRVYRFSGLHEKEHGMGNAFHFRSLGLELMVAPRPGKAPRVP